MHIRELSFRGASLAIRLRGRWPNDLRQQVIQVLRTYPGGIAVWDRAGLVIEQLTPELGKALAGALQTALGTPCQGLMSKLHVPRPEHIARAAGPVGARDKRSSAARRARRPGRGAQAGRGCGLFLRGGQLGPAETVAQRVLAHPALCMNALVETRARSTMERIRESSALLNATNRLSSVPEEFWPGGTHGQ